MESIDKFSHHFGLGADGFKIPALGIGVGNAVIEGFCVTLNDCYGRFKVVGDIGGQLSALAFQLTSGRFALLKFCDHAVIAGTNAVKLFDIGVYGNDLPVLHIDIGYAVEGDLKYLKFFMHLAQYYPAEYGDNNDYHDKLYHQIEVIAADDDITHLACKFVAQNGICSHLVGCIGIFFKIHLFEMFHKKVACYLIFDIDRNDYHKHHENDIAYDKK